MVGRATHSWGRGATGHPTRAWWCVQPRLLTQKRHQFLQYFMIVIQARVSLSKGWVNIFIHIEHYRVAFVRIYFSIFLWKHDLRYDYKVLGVVDFTLYGLYYPYINSTLDPPHLSLSLFHLHISEKLYAILLSQSLPTNSSHLKPTIMLPTLLSSMMYQIVLCFNMWLF